VNRHKKTIERKIRLGKNVSLYLRTLQSLSDWNKLPEDIQQGSLINHVKEIRELEKIRSKRLGKKSQSVNKCFYDLEECNKAFYNLIADKFFL
jgi:hypothetical protein